MRFIRVGKRRIQLRYVIMDEEYGGDPDPTKLGPGDVRVTALHGEPFILTGAAAEVYRYYADKETLPCPPRNGDGDFGRAHEVDPGLPPDADIGDSDGTAGTG